MNVLAAAIVVGASAGAVALCWPAARRTGLGIWHPALAWLALHAVFFGLGSAVLAIDGRPGPAWYVSGAAIVFGVAVALGDRVAGGRTGSVADRAADAERGDEAATTAERDAADRTAGPQARDPAPLRRLAVVALAGLGVVLVLPTLARVGLPILVEDITGARTELAGPLLQVVRVALPALALAVALGSLRAPVTAAPATAAPEGPARSSRRILPWLVVAILLALEIALASRYLAAELLAVLLVGVGLAGWRMRPRLLLAGALAAVVVFGGVQVLRAYDQAAGKELEFALARTVNRVVLIQPRTLEAIQAVIPGEEPHFGGLTWLRRLGPALDRPDIPNLGYWIYPRIFPGQDPPGYAAPGLIGEAWANFGVAGLALFALLGVVAERLGAFLGRRRHATGDLIAGALAVVFLARTHALGVNGLLFLLVLVAAWRIIAASGLTDTLTTVRAAVRWRI